MCFVIKKKFDVTKKIYIKDRFFVSNQNFTTEHVKVAQNSRFFSKFLKFQVFPGFFYLNCQIQGFSMFPGKVATLC